MKKTSKPNPAGGGRSVKAATPVSGTSSLFNTVLRQCGGLFATLVLTFLCFGSVRAQALSDSARVSLFTMLPGKQIHSMFGHSAFGIYDPVNKIDRVYNYGTFNFGEPGFVWKFVRRELDYKLSITTRDMMLREYQLDDRPVIEQVLNLPPWARESLFIFLETNYLPENRYYRYDFLFDNCSTRLRDALISVLGDDLTFNDIPAGDTTYRHLLDRYVVDRPGIDWGFDLGLGLPTDAVAGTHGAQFLPDYLLQAFDEATLRFDGVKQPLVASKTQLFNYRSKPDLSNELGWLLWPAWGIVLIVGILSLRSWSGPQVWRAAPADALLFGVAGLLGLLMTFLWFFTEHAVTKSNMNLLWAPPTHLLAALLLFNREPTKLLRLYLGLAIVFTGLTLAALPILPQSIHPVSAACMVLLLMRALVLWRRAAIGTTAPVRSSKS